MNIVTGGKRNHIALSVVVTPKYIDSGENSAFPFVPKSVFDVEMADGQTIRRIGPLIKSGGIGQIYNALPCDILRLDAMRLWEPEE